VNHFRFVPEPNFRFVPEPFVLRQSIVLAQSVTSLAAAWLLLGCSDAPLDAVVLPPERSSTDFTLDLVAHWSLDEGAGTTAADGSGNGHDGQLTGGTWISDGRFAGGLRLGAGEFVSVSTFPYAAPNFTVAAWLRLSPEQLAMNDETWVAILSTEHFFDSGWQLNIDNRLPRPRLDFAYWSPPLMTPLFVECECIETDRWIHVAVVVDVQANRVTLYTDGTASDDETRPSDILPGDTTLYFGRWNMDDRLFSGDLDDVAIWNRALTRDEIAMLHAYPLR
jgi:hypothetical protein